MIAYKVFTHDMRPPIQDGEPLWMETPVFPFRLPVVEVDRGPRDCGAGWNACATSDDALRIAGFWPTGRPSRLFRVETDGEVIVRGDKMRAATWDITAEVSDDEIEAAIGRLSEKWFGSLAAEMTAEQVAWRRALARPGRDERAVEAGLRAALDARGLGWPLRRFGDAMAARDTMAARDAWDAWNAMAARDARDTMAARDAWDASDARDARDARNAWNAMAARDAWDAWDARDAMLTTFASRKGWITAAPDRHTIGIRDAYAAGLAIALPTAPNELGWAMEE